jgi:UDP-GlcNAc:undecaprenyl-phosphate GlcNAc-1-phosphate transferase
MDGLAGGVAIIIGGAFLIISFLNLDSTTLTLSLALLGSVCGFIVYNLPPAKIYMGNSGSHFLGFIIAAISLLISYAPLERKIALLSPPLILGFPIFDTLFLCIMRLGKGKSAFRKSNDHLALRFLKLGYAKNRALLFMLILTLFFSICGVMLSQVPDFVGIIIIILVIALSITITLHMGRAPVDD